jgi:hypothetical protein
MKNEYKAYTKKWFINPPFPYVYQDREKLHEHDAFRSEASLVSLNVHEKECHLIPLLATSSFTSLMASGTPLES